MDVPVPTRPFPSAPELKVSIQMLCDQSSKCPASHVATGSAGQNTIRRKVLRPSFFSNIENEVTNGADVLLRWSHPRAGVELVFADLLGQFCEAIER